MLQRKRYTLCVGPLENQATQLLFRVPYGFKFQLRFRRIGHRIGRLAEVFSSRLSPVPWLFELRQKCGSSTLLAPSE